MAVLLLQYTLCIYVSKSRIFFIGCTIFLKERNRATKDKQQESLLALLVAAVASFIYFFIFLPQLMTRSFFCPLCHH